MAFSVVIPTYNRAGFLPATLEAILGQTVAPAEIIVVDDGSTDASPEVLARYAPRVRHLRIENSGELVARNTGVRAASSDRVAFCDSDDLWRPDFLAGMAALWRAEPRVRVAYADFVVVRDDAWAATSKFATAPAGFWDGLRDVAPGSGVFDQPIVDRLLRYQPFFPSCMAVDRAFFLGVGGWDEGVNRMVGMDFATTLRVAEHTPLGVIRQPLVGIRKHAGGYSADVQAMNLGDSRVLEHVLATRPSLARHEGAVRASIDARRQQALATAFVRHDFRAVQEIYPLLPKSARPLRARIKNFVAGLPAPIRGRATGVLAAMGTTRSHILRGES